LHERWQHVRSAAVASSLSLSGKQARETMEEVTKDDLIAENIRLNDELKSGERDNKDLFEYLKLTQEVR
jgi:hypothetical protein